MMANHTSAPASPNSEAVIEVNALADSMRKIIPGFVSKFEARYSEWESTWSSETGSNLPEVQPEYAALLQLGPASIPLIAQKLTLPNQLNAIQLYKDIETDPKLKVDSTGESGNNQHQADLIVNLNGSRNMRFKALNAAWKDHQSEPGVMFSSNSWVHASGDAYDSLIEMGPSIIGNIMREYVFDREHNQSAWWYRILHAIVVPERSYYQSVNMENQYNGWISWLEDGAMPGSVPAFL